MFKKIITVMAAAAGLLPATAALVFFGGLTTITLTAFSVIPGPL